MTGSLTRFFRIVPVILMAGAALLLVLVLLSFGFATAARLSAGKASDAVALNNRAMKLVTLVQAAESSQRGYLLTGEQHYLAPYMRARAEAALQFQSVSGDLEAAGIERASIDHLGESLQRKLAEMKETIDLKTAGNDAAALALVATDRGRAIMDDIQQIMLRIESVTSSLSARHMTSLQRSGDLLVFLMGGGALLVVMLVGGAMALLIRRARQLEVGRQALAAQNEDLEHRIRARTRFLEDTNRELQSYSYIVGHDLRAPLVNIMGFTAELERAATIVSAYLDMSSGPAREKQEALMREAVEEDIPEALRFIRSSMKRMDDLINEILKLARTGNRPLAIADVDLVDMLAGIVAHFQHRVEEAGATISVSPSIPAVRSDRLALQQIFSNLLDNALKYAEPGRPPVIVFSGERREGQIVVSVKDNGRGIAEQDLERVFQLFRRSGRQDSPGEGIGLSHVRALARRLGGDVTVVSTIGEGTCFEIGLAADLKDEEGGKHG